MWRSSTCHQKTGQRVAASGRPPHSTASFCPALPAAVCRLTKWWGRQWRRSPRWEAECKMRRRRLAAALARRQRPRSAPPTRRPRPCSRRQLTSCAGGAGRWAVGSVFLQQTERCLCVEQRSSSSSDQHAPSSPPAGSRRRPSPSRRRPTDPGGRLAGGDDVADQGGGSARHAAPPQSPEVSCTDIDALPLASLLVCVH